MSYRDFCFKRLVAVVFRKIATDTVAAPGRIKRSCILEQDGYQRMYGCGGSDKGAGFGADPYSSMAGRTLQRDDGTEPREGTGLGGARRQRQTISVLRCKGRKHPPLEVSSDTL